MTSTALKNEAYDLSPQEEKIAQMLALGHMRMFEIANHLNVSSPHITQKAKDPRIKFRVDELRKMDLEFWKVDRELLISKTFEAFDEAKKQANVNGMLAAVDRLAKLSGNEAATTVNVNHTISTSIEGNSWANKYCDYDEKPMIEAKMVRPEYSVIGPEKNNSELQRPTASTETPETLNFAEMPEATEQPPWDKQKTNFKREKRLRDMPITPPWRK